MLPAPSVEDILARVDEHRAGRETGDWLVSVVFADPGSPVWRDLRSNRSFMDHRTGDDWDLFFAGLSLFGPTEVTSQKIDDVFRSTDFPAYFNPQRFREIELWVAEGHAAALVADAQHEGLAAEPWRYRGGTDVVSFMAYNAEPDWLSLKSVPLWSRDGGSLTIVHVAEGLAAWKEDNIDPLFAPGAASTEVSTATPWLVAALGWTAAASTSGLLGTSAYELVRQVLLG